MSQGEIRLNPIYHFEETGERDGMVIGEWRQQHTLIHREKLLAAGLEGQFG